MTDTLLLPHSLPVDESVSNRETMLLSSTEVNSSSFLESRNPFEELGMIDKTWQMYRLSVMHYTRKNQSVEELLQTYVDSLNHHLKVEFQGPYSVFFDGFNDSTD